MNFNLTAYGKHACIKIYDNKLRESSVKILFLLVHRKHEKNEILYDYKKIGHKNCFYNNTNQLSLEHCLL